MKPAKRAAWRFPGGDPLSARFSLLLRLISAQGRGGLRLMLLLSSIGWRSSRRSPKIAVLRQPGWQVSAVMVLCAVLRIEGPGLSGCSLWLSGIAMEYEKWLLDNDLRF